MMSFLSYFVAKATFIFAAAFLLTLLMRRASAAARHFIWICALAAALALPVLSLLLPDWNLPVQMPAATTAARAVLVTPPAALDATDDARATTPVQSKPAVPWVLLIWLAGALIALARLVAGHLRMALSLRRARNVDDPGWAEARDEVSTVIGLRRIVALKRSGETDVPLTCGVFSTAVVLPDASDEWDQERRRVVLLHEFTHARRRDPLLWFIAQVAGAVYWFHPLAWLAVSRFRREQERSCDDAVIRSGTVRWAYAEHLVDLARSIAPMRAYAAALHMAATSDLEQRVRALLDPSRSRQGLRRGVCFACAAALLAAILPLAAVHAQDSGPAATLSGSVHDPSGAVVPDVLILLKKDASHQEAARSNASGEYKFSVPAGSYSMIVRASGFAEFQKGVILRADSKTNITLDVGQVNESMEVVGKAPPPPQLAGTPHRIRVGGNVQATKLIKMVKPVYPPGAEAAGIEGTVLLRAVISTGGDLLGLSVMNASVDAELAQAAMEAARQWHYQPTLLNGLPVEVVTTIAITFRLEH
jgi:TonB family protein